MITINQAEKEVIKMHQSVGSSVEYKSMYFLVFSSCLVFVLLNSLVKLFVHPQAPHAELKRVSIVAEARSAADSAVPYIFKK